MLIRACDECRDKYFPNGLEEKTIARGAWVCFFCGKTRACGLYGVENGVLEIALRKSIEDRESFNG